MDVHACETASDWSTTMVHVILSCDVTDPGESQNETFFFLSVAFRLPSSGRVCASAQVSCVSNLNLNRTPFFRVRIKNSTKHTYTHTHTLT